jgi:hypothetical protein
MAVTSYGWDGENIGDSGPYSAEEEMKIRASISPRGFFNPSAAGVFAGSGAPGPNSSNINIFGLDVLQTIPPSTSVRLMTGAAMVQNVIAFNDAIETLNIAANPSADTRIDTIVLRKDNTARTVRAAVLQGTPSAVPVPPTLTQDSTTWEIAIADITLAPSYTSITNANIQPRIHLANGGPSNWLVLKDVINLTGGEANTGDVVFTDGMTAITRNKFGDRVNGVWFGRTASGERGMVIVKGLAPTRMLPLQNPGAPVTSSTTARVGRALSDGQQVYFAGALGRLIENTPLNANLALVLVDGNLASLPTGEELIYRVSVSATSTTILDLPNRYQQYRVEWRLRSSTVATTEVVTMALGSVNTIDTTATNYAGLIVTSVAPTGFGTPTVNSNGNNGVIAGLQFTLPAANSPSECVGFGNYLINSTQDTATQVALMGQNSFRFGANTAAATMANQQLSGNWRNAAAPGPFNCLRISGAGTLTGYIAVYGLGVPFVSP